MLSVSRELIALYWDIGREIFLRQEQAAWGKSVVDRLAGDLQRAFPGVQGFSPVNVWRMRAFFVAYRDVSTDLSQAATESGKPNLSQAVTDLPEGGPPHPVADIPWGHNQVLLFKLKNAGERLWYAAMTLEHGWSRAMLTGVESMRQEPFSSRSMVPDTWYPPHLISLLYPLSLFICRILAVKCYYRPYNAGLRPGFSD